MQWIERGDKLVIVSETDATDLAVAERPVVRQLHESVRQKAENCAFLLNSIDESVGWSGFDEAFDLFRSVIEGETAEVAEQVGTLYSATISLGTFLEFDNDLRQRPQDFKNVQPFDPDQRRAFTDLIRTAAPWVRQFPTAAELDDEAGKLLTKHAQIEPATRALNEALIAELISKASHAQVHALLQAGLLSGVIAEKAATRGVFGIRNLIYVATGIWLGLSPIVGPGVAEKSKTLQAAETWLAESIDDVTAIVADLPEDIRLGMLDILQDFRPKPGRSGGAHADVAALLPDKPREGK